MIEELFSTRDETEHQQKKEAIKQTIHDYVHGNPETKVFCLFLPTTQDLGIIKQAAATASLRTGKRIDLIYPTGITREE